MSDEPVNVDSKTSLFKRFVALAKADFAKHANAYTSVTNFVVMGLALWMAVGPYFEARGAQSSQAEVIQLRQALAQANSDLAQHVGAAKANQDAADAFALQKAEWAAKTAELERKLDAALGGEGPKTPVAAPEPPIKRVKVKSASVVKPAEPTTWDQFVSWYEKNVRTPGATATPLAP